MTTPTTVAADTTADGLRRVRAQRLNRGLTCAAAADEIGIPRDTLRRFENGESRPRPATAKLIADFYGLLVTDILPVD